VLQAESIAQSAERGGLKVAQVEWAGGRNATIQGPTIDFQAFFSGRGVATNFIGQSGDVLFDHAANIRAFGLQFDHPLGYPAANAPAFPGAAPTAATGWTNVPQSFSPAMEMRMRVLDGTRRRQVRAERLDLRQHERRTTNYDKVLFSPTKSDGRTRSRPSQGRARPTSKVKIVGGVDGPRRPACSIKVEELTGDLSRVRLFHTSVSRAIASWPTWPGEPGFTGDFAEYLAQKFPTSTAGGLRDPRGRRHVRGDVRPAGACTGRPATSRCSSTSSEVQARTCSSPACRRPTSSSTSSSGSFGELPNGAVQPGHSTIRLNGVRRRVARHARRSSVPRTRRADEVLTPPRS
jgi:hypothetical protein